MEEKVYTPEVITDTPFPGGTEVNVSSAANSTGTFTPATTKTNSFPVKKIAVELLSTVLNTRSKKILGEFELVQSGGFKIGDYQQGLSGELKITPNGLTAKNIAGLTTFAIDGDTGNAVFAGELRSGSVVTGQVIVGDNNVIIDGDNRQILIFDESGNARILLGYQENGF
jgi:hypothetical protein